ncbi:acyl-CoA dehydrogenase family protein [Mycolicibacterium sp. 624]|uniref:acyl-CoA dehydrogenase family protein n=1 Tax=Mycolicibacterium sp. 624 TaxID=3156314 RepID=UPI003392D96E
MTAIDSVLANGVFGSAAGVSEFEAVRDLVGDLGRRAFDARLGRRRRPETFDGQLWDALTGSGLDRLTSVPENEAGPADLAVVLYELARYSAAVPVAETDLLGAWLAHRAGIDAPSSGPLTSGRGAGTVLGGLVTGAAGAMPWARTAVARVVLVEIRSAGSPAPTQHVALLGATDSVVTDGMNLAGEPRDEVSFAIDARTLQPVDPAVADEYECRGAWARCVQLIGALDAAAASSVLHCRERVQFGRPLSRQQSVQHTLAIMAGDIERARAAVTLAVAAAADFGFADRRTEYAVSVAKTVLGPVVGSVTAAAHQLHGAIGTSIEHALWLSTLRARSWIDEFGSTATHARRLGRTILSEPDFWDCVTGSQQASAPQT